MLLNLHKFHHKSFDYLGISIGLRRKKLWLERCFCTVCQIHLCHCVTWKVWQNHARNWFLDGLLQLCQQCYTDMRQPKIYFVQDLKFTSGQTGKIPFEILQNVTVWHFASLSECSLFKKMANLWQLSPVFICGKPRCETGNVDSKLSARSHHNDIWNLKKGQA